MTIVRFEAPSLRKHDRVTAPAAVVFDQVRYTTLQWSPGGFCLQGYRGPAIPGERTRARFVLNFQGFEVGFDALVEVCRVDSEAETLAARYIELGERQQELLKHFLTGLVSGQIHVVGDTMQHLDIPLHALPAPSVPNDPASRLRRLRTLAGRSLLYLIAGPIVLGFALLAIYRTFFHLEIQTAVVARPVESLVSLGTGRMSQVFVREGQAVVENQKLFSVDDEQVDREVENARLDRDAAFAELAGAKSATRSGNQRLDVYKNIARDKLTVAQERVRALREEGASAQNHLERMQALFDKGFETQANLDQAKADGSRVQGALREALAELEIAKDAVHAAKHGSFYDGLRLVEEGPQFHVAETAANVRAQLAEERYRAAQARAEKLTCRAPFAGSLVRLLKGPGSTVNRGEEIAFVERMQEAPRIQALLTQTEVGEMKVGARVTVRVPALARNFSAVVEHVDRANLVSNPLLANPVLRPAWPGTVDRSAWMSVALVKLSPGDRASLRSGMPAVIMMGRNEMIASFRPTRW